MLQEPVGQATGPVRLEGAGCVSEGEEGPAAGRPDVREAGVGGPGPP